MKKSLSLLALFLSCALLLCSCGDSYSADKSSAVNGSFQDTGKWDYSDDIAMDIEESAAADWNTADFPMEEPMEGPMMPEPEPAAAPTQKPQAQSGSAEADALKKSQRKIIKNKELSVETLEYDSFIQELQRKVDEFGGYIENSTQNGNTYYGKGLRSANYTIRIPAERFDEFTSIIGDMAAVTYTYEYIDDITAKYVDVEARLASLKAERESFLKLMDKAETIEDILNIQSYLTDVNYQIESYTAQLNSYKSLVSYSTLRLDVCEVERITPVSTARPGVFERIKSNLSENLYNIGEGAKDLFVGIVSSSPYLGILAVISAFVLFIVLKVRKKAKKAEEKFYKMYTDGQNPKAESGENQDGKDNSK